MGSDQQHCRSVTACRVCDGRELEPVLDYGEVALAGRFVPLDVARRDEPRYPLRLCVCGGCGHVQIDHVVDPELLFRDYIYVTGFSSSIVRHAEKLCDAVRREISIGNRPPRVLELASNDGTVLRVFKDKGWEVLGVDPAANIAAIANEAGIPTIAEFFNQSTAERVAAEHPAADVVVARNVIAHVADLSGFVSGLRTVLARDGVAVIECPHALTMFEELQYDQVFHEHMGYFSLQTLDTVMRRFDLGVFDVEEVPLHGGSIQAHVAHLAAGRPRSAAVGRVLAWEERWELGTAACWRLFARHVDRQKQALVRELESQRRAGLRLAAYGAPAKGQSMLMYCGIGEHLLDYVVDKSTWKHGKVTPGTHLPIRPPQALAEDRPDILLLSAWNFADEIVAEQREYLATGRMLHPLPLPHYIG